MRYLKTIVLGLAVACGLSAGFVIAQSMTAVEIENQAKALEKEIVAPCCWTNPISEHYSQVSYELRTRIRGWLQEGKDREAIKTLLVTEYGERILAKPRGVGFTLLVWTVPPLVGVLALILVWRFMHRRRRQSKGILTRALDLPAVPPADMEAKRRQLEAEIKKLGDIA